MKKILAKFTAAFAAGVGLAVFTCGALDNQAQAQTQAPVASSPQAEARPEEEPIITDFVRYVEKVDSGADVDQLQTVVRSYRRGATEVDLVAVIHIADPEYYRTMNELLDSYEVVLYEMVGGPFQKRDLNAAEADPSMAGIKVLHNLMQNMLALEYQTEGIDYDKAHFVHADADWDEYSRLMASHNQSMATLFQRAMAISMSGKSIPGIPNSNEGNNALLGGLLQAVTSGDSDGLKRIVAPMLSEAETFISMIEGEGDDGTVIISERNKIVMRSIGEQIQAGKKSIGVFYGAGHMPDLEGRLIEKGFQPVGYKWYNAWQIGESANGSITNGVKDDGSAGVAPSSGDAAVVNVLGFFGKLLQDEELMESVVSGVRRLVEPAQEAGVDARED